MSYSIHLVMNCEVVIEHFIKSYEQISIPFYMNSKILSYFGCKRPVPGTALMYHHD